MKISKTELLTALNAVKSGVAAKSIIAQMENVSFRGQDLVTYNDQICVLYPFETDFQASIRHKDLYKIVEKIPTEEFDMYSNDSEVIISTNDTRAGLTVAVEDEIGENIDSLIEQLPNDDDEFKWSNLPPDFMRGALLCTPAASTDTSQGVLTCLYANNTDLICSDNLRVSLFELSESLNTEFFIKASIVKELAHFEFDQFCVAKSWVHFQTKTGTIFSVRLLKGEGLSYFKQLFDGFDGEVIELPDNLKDLIDTASVMAVDDQLREMNITFENGKIICSTHGPRGWIEKEMPVKYENDTPIKFIMSASFLKEILGMPLTMIVGKNKSLFISGNFNHVLIHKLVTN